MAKKDIKTMEVKELLELVQDSQESIRVGRFTHAGAPKREAMKISNLRKIIARVKTELTARGIK